MDKLGDEKMGEAGLLKGILDATPLRGLGVTPQLLDREIVIELTTEQLKAMLLQNADARAKESVIIELHEGKLTLKIRLW
jgi:hypothetical protein